MIIYSFDTGISTGVSIFDSQKEELTLQTIASDKLYVLLNDFFHEKPDYVVLERIPSSSEYELMKLFQLVIDTCCILNITFRIIAPASWKPLAKARKWKCSIATTDHESDSYFLMRYFIITNLKKSDLGDL